MQIDNGATPVLEWPMISSADDKSAVTGLTVTAQISKNGGAWTNTTNAVAEYGAPSNGWYKVTLTATETNTNGGLALRATAPSGANEWRDIHEVQTAPFRVADFTSTLLNQIADHVLRRQFKNARASVNGDSVAGSGDLGPLRSLMGVIAKAGNRVRFPTATQLAAYAEDDTTVFGTQTVATSSGGTPVVELNTD